LREERESCVGVAKGSGIWPETAGKKRREKRERLYPKINLKFYQQG